MGKICLHFALHSDGIGCDFSDYVGCEAPESEAIESATSRTILQIAGATSPTMLGAKHRRAKRFNNRGLSEAIPSEGIPPTQRLQRRELPTPIRLHRVRST